MRLPIGLPQTDVGRLANVRRLVDEAHRRGLAVIFDVVCNHASTDINHYWEYDGDAHTGRSISKGVATSRAGSSYPGALEYEVR